MNNLFNSVRQLIGPSQPLEAGIYQYQSPMDDDPPLRLHLRVDSEGQGLLIINASTVLHLNQTAAEYAYHFIKQTTPAETAKII